MKDFRMNAPAALLLAGFAYGGGLTGTIRDRFGDPVEGALARLAEMKEGAAPCGFHPAVDSVLTDAEGRFRFEAPSLAGFHEVQATLDGQGSVCDFAEATDPATVLDLAIGGPGSPGVIRGIALSQGNPQVRIPRVRFIFTREFQEPDTLETDSTGRFSLVNLEPASQYTLRVDDSRLERMSYVFYDLNPGDTRLARMELEPVVVRTGKGSISGKVIDQVTSEPLRDVLVRLEEKAGRGPPVRDSTRTDAGGNYSFTGLPETSEPGGGFGYIVMATKERYELYASDIIPLRAGERKLSDLSLRRMLMLRVRVRDRASGEFLAGARVVILRADETFPFNNAVTDGAGGILFGHFQPGEIRLSVSKPGFRTRSLGRTLDGSAWEDSVEVAMESDAPVTSKSLHGKITDPAGNPAAVDVYFSCAGADGEAWLLAIPGPDGAWLMPGIPAECREGTIRTYATPGEAVVLTGADTEVNLVRTPITTSVRRIKTLRAPGSGRSAAGSGRDALGRLRSGGRPHGGRSPLVRARVR